MEVGLGPGWRLGLLVGSGWGRGWPGPGQGWARVGPGSGRVGSELGTARVGSGPANVAHQNSMCVSGRHRISTVEAWARAPGASTSLYRTLPSSQVAVTRPEIAASCVRGRVRVRVRVTPRAGRRRGCRGKPPEHAEAAVADPRALTDPRVARRLYGPRGVARAPACHSSSHPPTGHRPGSSL